MKSTLTAKSILQMFQVPTIYRDAKITPTRYQQAMFLRALIDMPQKSLNTIIRSTDCTLLGAERCVIYFLDKGYLIDKTLKAKSATYKAYSIKASKRKFADDIISTAPTCEDKPTTKVLRELIVDILSGCKEKSRKDLADEAGTSISHVYRALSELKKDKVVVSVRAEKTSSKFDVSTLMYSLS